MIEETSEHSKKSKYLKGALAFSVVHLILVICGAFGLSFPLFPGLKELVNYYGEMSGASCAYGFFAPGISSQVRAVFDITDKKNGTTTVPIETGQIREVDLRVGDLIEQFFNDRVDNRLKYQRVLSASLAGAMFGSHPEAESVRIRLEQITPPSMEEYRQGKSTTWQKLYSAQFIKHKKYVRKLNP